MKRFLTTALMLGIVSSGGLIVGCGEKSEFTQKETVQAPGGTTETTKDTTVKSTGENPPPNSQGQTAEGPKEAPR
jgi:hypothetical protein